MEPENGKTESVNKNENKKNKDVESKIGFAAKTGKHKRKSTKWYEGVEAV